MAYAVFFFFSSRRRHTRYWRDWSSDVCSSDLEAGMSKATFYEHFRNKEECILALFDAAIDVVIAGLDQAAREVPDRSAQSRVAASVRGFLEVVAAFPDQAQTLL